MSWPDDTTRIGLPAAAEQVAAYLPYDWARADDVTLMAAVGTGSAAAFAVLVDRHHVGLNRAALRLLGDAHEAQDVVQEVFAKVWVHAGNWRPVGAGLAGWLNRVTTNLCLDRKRRFRVVVMPDVPDMVDETPGADHAIMARQARAALAHALAILPERHARALDLCYLQGLSNAAGAQLMGMNIKAMESLLHRARRQLRDVLAMQQVNWRDLLVD